MTTRIMTPSPSLRRKYAITIWLVFLLAVFPLVFLGFIPEMGWTYVVVFLLVNALWIVPSLLLLGPYCRSISYELGQDDVIVHKGILTKTTNVVPYRTVTNVSVKRGVLDRWLGMGTLDIHTAGYSQQTNAEASLVGLVEYERIHTELMTRLHQQQAETALADTVPHATETDNVVSLLTEIRDELRQFHKNA